MVSDNSIVIQYSALRNYDIANELLQSKAITCSISDKQAKRIKHDWDKYGAYKFAYAEGNSRKGLSLSFTWMIINVYRSFFYGDLEKISSLYYDLTHKLLPVEFLDNEEGSVLVIFRRKSMGSDSID
jgi:hypothetical protein